MIKSLKIRIAITAVVCLAALYFLLPTLIPQLPTPWNEYFPKDKIHLGLDLQGGMHLVLEVDTEKALESMMERTANDLKESLMENKVIWKSQKVLRSHCNSLNQQERPHWIKSFLTSILI